MALGLPFAVAAGWALGAPEDTPPAVSAPGGSGVLGSAPVASRPAPGSSTWVPRAPKRVSDVEPIRSGRRAAVPSSATPSASASGSVAPSLTLPPVPTPTSAVSTPPDPDAPATSASATPTPTGLRLVRRS